MQALIKRFKTLILFVSLLLNVWIALPNAAQADKIPGSFPLATETGVVNVAAIYETTYPTRKSVKTALKLSKSTLKKASGFQGMSIFQSQDGLRTISLSQWQDLASFQAYSSALTKETTDPSSSTTVTPARTIIFEVAKIAAREGAIPAIRGKEAIVQFNEFSLKNPDDQLKVLSSVEELVPTLIENKPAPQSVVLLKSTDNTEVALLANWNCTADFEETGKPTGLAQASDDLITLADTDQRFYNVANIMSATKPKLKS